MRCHTAKFTCCGHWTLKRSAECPPIFTDLETLVAPCYISPHDKSTRLCMSLDLVSPGMQPIVTIAVASVGVVYGYK